MFREPIYAQLADAIFNKGAFKFGAFKLKLHEKNPNAPLSPFYLNLRRNDNPTNPGPLDNNDFDLIAKNLLSVVRWYNLKFQAIAGIPHAADPIIEAIERQCPEFRIIKLHKEVNANKRRIVPMPGFEYREGEKVLVIDDLVTMADSKVEAIKAIESEGSVVEDLVVLIDREQGGKEQFKKAGYNLYPCFSIFDLLSYYLSASKITPAKHEECIDYLLQ